MSVRVRYEKSGENLLDSVRMFQVGSTKYRARLNTSNNSYVIFDVKDDIIAASGVEPDFILLKKTVRTKLKELGVQFEEEKRERNKEPNPYIV